jgi:hypothetical protein
MPIQTHVKLNFSGQTVVGLAPQFSFVNDVPGGVAQGADGPIAQYAGTGRTHFIRGVTLYIPTSGLAFDPENHRAPGQEFDAEFNQGDPALGGKNVTYHECLCRGPWTFNVDNEQGLIKLSGDIQAVRRT